MPSIQNFFFSKTKSRRSRGSSIPPESGLILWIVIALQIIIVFSLLIIKYNTFGYNAIDLGIYSQVLYNTAQGDLFQLSIHPHLYLGDHFELILLLITPFYALLPSPLTLLFIQTALIALAAWPLYLIARIKLNKLWSLLIAIAFLINPVVLNMAFFEFHALPFAIFFLLFTFYFYKKGRFVPFLIFIILSLLVREDVSLAILMFGLLAVIEKKSLRWILTPLVLGGAWFIMAIKLTGYFNQYGNYKFLSLYGWLGSNLLEVIINLFTQPIKVLKQIFSFNNLFSFIGLLIPVGLLPLLKPKYLFPALLIIFQLLLLSASSTIVLQTHYPTLIIPFLFITTISALSFLIRPEQKEKSKLKTFVLANKLLFHAILIVAVIYPLVTFSPIIPAIKNAIQSSDQKNFVKEKNDLVSSINSQEAVLASYEFLPGLANRNNLYSLHYAFRGQKQFSDQPYEIPVALDKLIINFDDFNTYYFQSDGIALYATGHDRINNIIESGNFNLTKITDTLALYEKNSATDIKLIEKEALPIISGKPKKSTALNDNFTLYHLETNNILNNSSAPVMPLTIYWQAIKKPSIDYRVELALTNANGKKVYSKIYPLAYGLYPTSHWSAGEVVKINYWFLVPEKFRSNNYQPTIQVVDINGFVDLAGDRSARINVTKKNNIGPAIPINYSTL